MKLFRNFRRNLRLAADSVSKIQKLDEEVKKLSPKVKEQGGRLREIRSSTLQQENETRQLVRSTESLQLLCGKLASESLASKPAGTPFSEIEFKVFSQWGEDGIIQHLIHHLKPAEQTFVEFGVETYTEANTRFLLANNNWRGLILDGSDDNMNCVRQSELYWKYDLTAVTAFITPSNINSLISGQKFGPRVGILSVDIDGMDYWVLQAINVQADILICEYNSVFGPVAKVTVPPNDTFQRSSAHHSNLFYGMSLSAAAEIASAKGYDLVGVNSAGNNAFFVHRSVASPFKSVTPQECFVAAKFRESRSPSGELTLLDFEARQKEIENVEAYDLSTSAVKPLKDIWAATQSGQ
ncbi:MAG: hypothetical protein JNJ83_16795 [Verrucomicrobiaceae bacterium]|nr:hypothetical protein [Verrucomicrobiaceae bacterium]